MRVLIVEDSEPLAALIAAYVRPIARSVTIAHDMATAMRELNGVNPFDIVTLDLNLPDSNVSETLAKVAEIKQVNPSCLLVVITGMMSPDQEAVALRAGADGFMHKSDSIANGADSFLQTLRDIGRSILRVPQRYQKNIAFLEKLTDRISEHVATVSNNVKPIPENQP